MPCNGGNDCCTESHQCHAGEGDCDKDGDCLGTLTCGTNNCPISASMSTDMDCCSVHDGCMYNSN